MTPLQNGKVYRFRTCWLNSEYSLIFSVLYYPFIIFFFIYVFLLIILTDKCTSYNIKKGNGINIKFQNILEVKVICSCDSG